MCLHQLPATRLHSSTFFLRAYVCIHTTASCHHIVHGCCTKMTMSTRCPMMLTQQFRSLLVMRRLLRWKLPSHLNRFFAAKGVALFWSGIAHWERDVHVATLCWIVGRVRLRTTRAQPSSLAVILGLHLSPSHSSPAQRMSSQRTRSHAQSPKFCCHRCLNMGGGLTQKWRAQQFQQPKPQRQYLRRQCMLLKVTKSQRTMPINTKSRMNEQELSITRVRKIRKKLTHHDAQRTRDYAKWWTQKKRLNSSSKQSHSHHCSPPKKSRRKSKSTSQQLTQQSQVRLLQPRQPRGFQCLRVGTPCLLCQWKPKKLQMGEPPKSEVENRRFLIQTKEKGTTKLQGKHPKRLQNLKKQQPQRAQHQSQRPRVPQKQQHASLGQRQHQATRGKLHMRLLLRQKQKLGGQGSGTPQDQVRLQQVQKPRLWKQMLQLRQWLQSHLQSPPRIGGGEHLQLDNLGPQPATQRQVASQQHTIEQG